LGNRRRQRARRLLVEGLEARQLLTFLPAVDYSVGGSPQAVVTGDFNGDGHLDLATGNPVAGTVSVLLGDGGGGFGNAIDSSYGGSVNGISLTVADFDNDGADDLAFVSYDTDTFLYGSGVGVLLSNRDGTFGSLIIAATHDSSLGVAAGDFNNDGNTDLVVTGFDSYAAWDGWDFGFVQVLSGNGQGGFAQSEPYYRYTNSQSKLTVGDLNGDGNLDVVAVRGDYIVGDALLGNGAGQFGSQGNFFMTNYGIGGVGVGDFTGDGIPDLVVAGLNIDTFVGRGDGTFDRPINHSNNNSYANFATGVAVADFNGDGLLDAVTSDANKGTVSELLGNGDGTLTEAVPFSVGSSPMAVAVGDFNGDGRPDIATANAGSNTVSVLLNDGAGANGPWLRIEDASVTEGHAGDTIASFVVTLSAASSETVTVHFATTDSDATAGSDYQAISGTLTFAPGEISKTVAVPVHGDRLGESHETFLVNLSGAINATITDGRGVGTIVNDEPWINITRTVYQTEGNAGQTPIAFDVTLSQAYDLPVTVDWATADVVAVGSATQGPATAGSDYQATGGTLTFAPGETSKTITVPILGDTIFERDEWFVVNLSGTTTNATIGQHFGDAHILNDDVAPRISISDVTKSEGKKGKTTLFTFTVTLSAAYDQPVTMSFRTLNGTATTSNNDYVAKSGTLTFAPGETTKTITIEVKGDSKREGNETFYLDLFGLSGNASFTKNRGIGTILNDD
jgi:hypothetical protein